MCGLIKKTFMKLLISIINASNHTKCISMSNRILIEILIFILMNTVKNMLLSICS